MRNVPRITRHATKVPRNQEEFITQVSEEIKGEVTKKQSHEFRFSRIENCNFGALSQLDDIPKIKWREPGNKWGSLPELSSSWSECLFQSVLTRIQPRRDFLQERLCKIPHNVYHIWWLRRQLVLWMRSGGHMIWNFSQKKVYIKVTKQTFPERSALSVPISWLGWWDCLWLFQDEFLDKWSEFNFY